jgi:hypothetical protein
MGWTTCISFYAGGGILLFTTSVQIGFVAYKASYSMKNWVSFLKDKAARS